MVDLHSKVQSLHLAWLTRLLENNHDAPSKYKFIYWIEQICPLSLKLKTNCSRKDMLMLCSKHSMPDFYVNLLASWSELTHVDMLEFLNVKMFEIKYYGTILVI